MPAGAAMILAENVSHSYSFGEGEFSVALNGVSFSVAEGEFVAVAGANGSGKSTLARHLNALLLPTEGDVRINGMNTREEQNTWAIRKTAGMVFQNPDNQLVAGIVEEDVAFGPENLGVEPGRIRELVDESLDTVGMAEYSRKSPHMLSGGQKQRVAIAGVLAMQPKLIVLDEATAMLDPNGKNEVLSTVLELNKTRRMTVVYITHFMSETLCADRLIVMNAGSIVMDAEPREVFGNAELLNEYKLDVPPMMRLWIRLMEAGIELPKGIISVEEMAEALCPLL